MAYPTLIHERVDLARKGENPTVICRVTSGWVVLGDDQRLRGYCLLLSDPICEHLHMLDPAARSQFLADMTAIGDALIEVVKPSIINYSILGNLDRALHAHVHPRYDSEEPEYRRDHPIRYHWLKQPPVPFDAARDRELMGQLREALEERGQVAG